MIFNENRLIQDVGLKRAFAKPADVFVLYVG
jgi:hypothetical protein